MIHYFNPGHETAVLNQSKYYQPAANQVKMQEDLAYLPAWYAQPGDYVLTHNEILPVSGNISDLFPEALNKEMFGGLKKQKVDIWGLSPQAIYFAELFSEKHKLDLDIPTWTDSIYKLNSRVSAWNCLRELIQSTSSIESDILPNYYTSLEEIEKRLLLSDSCLLLKSPYSSSGRGLLWLPAGEIDRSSKQIITGLLRKQKQVSLEKVLDKQLDFSMHYETKDNQVIFRGYSLFNTNSKGAYTDTILDSQDNIAAIINQYHLPENMDWIKEMHRKFIEESIAPYYTGNIGIDMMIYRSENDYKLHPCVEINLRKSMGYLSLCLYENHIQKESRGNFYIDYLKEEGAIELRHQQLSQEYPLQVIDGKIKSGYLSLCPVRSDTKYQAYVIVIPPSETFITPNTLFARFNNNTLKLSFNSIVSLS